MQAAINQFHENMTRVKHLQAIYTAFSGLTTNVIDLSDLLRLQIVMCVSALDQYIHEVTRLGMIEVFEGRRVRPPGFSKVSVSIDGVLQSLTSGNSLWFDNEIRMRHSYISFQQPDKIADAIRYFSNIQLWNEVSQQLNQPQREVKLELQLIIDRRNKISHEADLDPSFPNTRWPITPADVQYSVHFVEKLCEVIHVLIV